VLQVYHTVCKLSIVAVCVRGCWEVVQQAQCQAGVNLPRDRHTLRPWYLQCSKHKHNEFKCGSVLQMLSASLQALSSCSVS
jgi:hypothetical protein